MLTCFEIQSINNYLDRYLEGKLIESASLLYRFDPKNKTNLHEYIDNRKNILFVAKAKDMNNRVIGAFSSRAI